MDYIAFFQVILISFTAALASKLVMAKTVDLGEVNKKKKRIKLMRKEMKELKPGSKRYNQISNKMLDLNMEITKMQLKPSLYTMVPFLLLFFWMSQAFKDVGAFLILPFSLPIIGNDIGWLLTYFISTMIFSAIITKVMDRIYPGDENV